MESRGPKNAVAPTAASTPTGVSKEMVQEFIYLLVRDYLTIHNLTETLHCFTDESKKKNVSLPDANTWYEVSNAIQLNRLMQEYSFNTDENQVSVLQIIMDKFVSEHQKLLRAETPSTVFITRQSSLMSMKKEQDEQNKSLKYSTSTPVIPASDIDRPKTALTPSTTTKMKKSESRILHSGGNRHESMPDASLLLRADRIEKARTDPNRSRTPYRSTRTKEDTFNKSPTKAKPHKAALPNVKAYMKKHMMIPSDDEPASNSLSNQHWIPDEKRDQMLRRDLNIVTENVRKKVAFDEGMKKFSVREELEANFEKIQNEALGKKKIPCKLCELPFHSHNLVCSVSYKLITSLRHAWEPNFKEPNPALARPPRCYDKVRVCRYCSQFIENAHIYVKTPEEKTEALRLLKQKEDEEARRQEYLKSNRQDPLAHDAFSSDSDSAESEGIIEGNHREKKSSLVKRRSTLGGKLALLRSRIDGSVVKPGTIGKRLQYASKNQLIPHLDQREWKTIKGTTSDLFNYHE